MASPLVRDVILRDGSALRLRSPEPADEAAIKAFFDGLSAESRYTRFHGAGRTDIVSRDYAHADGDTRVALLARLGDRVVAVAGYDRLNEPGVAEVAFAVADDMQGRGLATRMLEQLAEVAAERGVRRFDAEVLVRQPRACSASSRAPGSTSAARPRSARRTSSSTSARASGPRSAMAERVHRAAVASLRPVLAPASVAVVGASAREGSVGAELLRRDRRGRLRRRRGAR